jgi:hypothetical protein
MSEYDLTSGLFGIRPKRFIINERGVDYNGNFITSSDYKSLIIGSTDKYINGLKEGSKYTVEIRSSDKKIKFTLRDWFYFKGRGKIFSSIYPEILKFVGGVITSKLLGDIKNGKTVVIGRATFNTQGVSVIGNTYFGWNTAPIYIPYERVFCVEDRGFFRIMDSENSKLDCSMRMRLNPNACILRLLIPELTQKADRVAIL